MVPAVILALLLVVFGVMTVISFIRSELEQKRRDDERRRESMRAVAERWHFREWERDLRSSDTV